MYTIYTGDGCPFCKKAKDLLETYGEEFEEINIKHSEYREALITQLQYMGIKGPYKVPQIWGPDGYIPGGYEGLRKELE